MSFDKNEPASPCPEAAIARYGHSDGFMGMDIRTTIATKMMQGLLSHPNNLICYRLGEDNLDFQSTLTDTEIANKAISLADALIEELNK